MNKRKYIISGIIAIVILAVAVNQFFILRKAHSTFENYYAFRGCTELVSRTDDTGMCKVSSGDTIKIVKFEGKWYLDGDLPICWSGVCL